MVRTALYEYNNGTFAFRNGERITVDIAQLDPGIVRQLILHGLKQKVADAAAIPRNTDTGRAASDEEKMRAMEEVAVRLMNGQWNANREGGGTTGGLLLRALCELYPVKTRDQLADYLAGKTDKEKAALRASARIAPVIERLKAEAGRAAGIDADDLLDELAD